MSDKIKKSDVSEKDPFGNLGKSAVDAKADVDLLNISLEMSIELAKKIKAGLADLKPKDTASIKQMNTLTSQANLIAKERISIDKKIAKSQAQLKGVTKEQRQELAKARVENQRANKEAKQTVLLKDKEAGAYTRASTQLAIYKKRLKDAAISGKMSRKETRKLQRAHDILDRKVKAADASVRQFGRNVGNYPKVMGRARSAINGLGIAFGGLIIAREAFKALTELEEGAANISKTTGLAKEAAIELSTELLKIDTRSSVASLQELATAAGRLGIVGSEGIEEFVEAADKAFVALGDDLGGTADEIATQMGKISSLFGLEDEFGVGEGIEKVGSGINELAASSKAAAPAILDFTNRLAGFSEVLELQDVQALGALFDEAGQSTEVAASTMLKLLPNLAKEFEKFADVAGKAPEEFKAIAENAPIEALKLVAEGAKSNEKGLFALTETLESYGIESVRATGIVTVLSNNTERLTELQNLAGTAIAENTSLTNEFNAKNNTLLADVEKLKKRFTEWLFGVNRATGGLSKARKAVQFLTKNLDKILRVLKLVVIAWAGWKLGSITSNIITAGRGLVTMAQGLRRVKGATDAATTSQRSFNTAVKSNPLGLIISLLATAIALYMDYADTVDDATTAQEKFNDGLQQGLDFESGIATGRTKAADDQIKKINQRLELELKGIKTEEERLKLTKAAQEEQKKVLMDLNQVNAQDLNRLANQREALEVLVGAVEKLDKFKNAASSRDKSNAVDARNDALKTLQNLGFQKENIDSLVESNVALGFTTSQQKVLTEQILATNAKLSDLGHERNLTGKDILLNKKKEGDEDKKSLTRLQQLQKELKKNKEDREKLVNENTSADDKRLVALSTEGRLIESQIEAIKKLLDLKLKIEEVEDRASKQRLELIEAELDAQRKLIAFDPVDAGQDPENAVFIDELKIKRDLEIKKSEIELKFLRITLQEKLDLVAESADFEGKTFEEIQEARLKIQTLENKIRSEQFKADLEDNLKEQLDLENEFLDNKLNLNKEADFKLQQQSIDAKIAALEEEKQRLGVGSNKEIDDKILALEKDRNDQIIEFNDDKNKTILEKEKEFQKKMLELKLEEIRIQQLPLDPESKKFKELENEKLKLQEELNDLDLPSEEELQERFELRAQLVDVFTQKFLSDADKRIRKIDEEINAAKRQADVLAGLAASGNIKAAESLREQDEIIREANLRKEQEEKRKQQIILVSSIIQSYNSALEGGATPSEALASSITNTLVLKQFVEALPTFLEGTEDTGTHGQGIDGKGGFHAVLHPNERVMTKEQNELMGGYSNDDVARIVNEYQYGSYASNVMPTIGASINTDKLESKLEAVQQEIKNKEVPKIELGKVTQAAMFINETKKRGNWTTTNSFKVQ